MAEFGVQWRISRFLFMILFDYMFVLAFGYAKRSMNYGTPPSFLELEEPPFNVPYKAIELLWKVDQSGYRHVWPEIRFGWQIVVGTIIGAFGAACGSIGGVGGGGIFVPMLTLIVGFDSKSAAAMSKCMIMGAAGSTIYYNLKLRHPTLDMPIIDYDLVLLIQPMLMLGISIGVTLNVIFADWMVTIMLIILCLVTSLKAFFKGIETWKVETISKQKIAEHLESSGNPNREADYKPLPGGPRSSLQAREVSILENIYWKELGLLAFVWIAYLAIQIAKNYTSTCSTMYWLLNLLQIPVSIGVFLYEAIGLYKGKRLIRSKGNQQINWRVQQLLVACICGILAGVVGGLLGLGGGFIMGPIFLELGIPPQVVSATATFGMAFSSSMSVVEYHLLKRFPVPYALYFIVVAIIAAFIGQHIITKLISTTGRASLIIFVLAFTIFISAIALGGVGITSMVGKIEQGDYMGFDSLCDVDRL